MKKKKKDCDYCDNGSLIPEGTSGFCIHCHRTALSYQSANEWLKSNEMKNVKVGKL